MRAGHFVLEGVSGLVLAHGELQTIAFDKKKKIIFGIIDNDSKFCSALNHLVIIGKYFLYVKALNSKCYTLNEFVSLARDKIRLEKYISSTTGREKMFKTKWSVFSSLINIV